MSAISILALLFNSVGSKNKGKHAHGESLWTPKTKVGQGQGNIEIRETAQPLDQVYFFLKMKNREKK